MPKVLLAKGARHEIARKTAVGAHRTRLRLQARTKNLQQQRDWRGTVAATEVLTALDSLAPQK